MRSKCSNISCLEPFTKQLAGLPTCCLESSSIWIWNYLSIYIKTKLCICTDLSFICAYCCLKLLGSYECWNEGLTLSQKEWNIKFRWVTNKGQNEKCKQWLYYWYCFIGQGWTGLPCTTVTMQILWLRGFWEIFARS